MDKLKKILKIALITMVVMIGLSLVFSPQIGKYFQHKYYRETYQPVEIDAGSIRDFPPSYRVKGVPWISYKKSYCHPAALQMIARRYKIRGEVGYFNFLMGFTYGAVYRTGMTIFVPYTDPVAGFIAAAPYLGLKLRCLTTDDRDAFLKAVRFYLSIGHPVAVELDVAKLWKEEKLKPHIELLVGYDEKGFEYFETGKKDRSQIWARGLKVSEDTLVEAVTSVTKELIAPWKFSLFIFEKDNKKEDLKEIWTRNGNSLVGKKAGPMASGSQAIRQFASKFKKTGKVSDVDLMEAAAYTRMDNAKFLRRHFSGDKDVEKAAGLLKEAGNCYKEVLGMMKKSAGDKQKAAEISDILLNVASIEKEVGEIFLTRGKQ